MTNEQEDEKKKAALRADQFFRKLCAGGFRDEDKRVEGGHRNPRPKKRSKRRINYERQSVL